jgi:FKBP-type peptidyl-prolyl cis-trans isomerase
MKNSFVLLLLALAFGISSAFAQGSNSNSGKLPEAPAPKNQTAPPAAANQNAAANQTPSPFKDQKEKLGYAIGMFLANRVRPQAAEFDANSVAQGLKDGLSGGKTLLTEEESTATINQWQTEMRAKQEQKMQQEGEANKKEGEAFLAANKSKEGVVTLPSGLQYKVIKQGTGPKPTASDTVVCNYKGTLINGTEFDSSYKRGEPATFPVSGVIKGWTEALQLMPVGSKWQLFIPSDLAYGPRAVGNDIGPNSTLIFEVELLSIQPKQGEEPAKPGDAAKPK